MLLDSNIIIYAATAAIPPIARIHCRAIACGIRPELFRSFGISPTDEPREAPLKGFSPNQPHLISAIQTGLEEI